MTAEPSEISLTAAGELLGCSPRQVRRLAAERPELVLGLDLAGRRRLSRAAVEKLAIARAQNPRRRAARDPLAQVRQLAGAPC